MTDIFRTSSHRIHVEIKTHWLLFLLSGYFASILNVSLWRYVMDKISFSEFGWLFPATMPIFIIVTLYLLFSLFLWPYLAKPFFILLLLVSSTANYFMFQYGLFIDSDMIRNVLETNQREAFDLITAPAVLWIMLTGVIPAVFLALMHIRYRSFFKEIAYRLLGVLACLLIIGLIAAFFYKDYASFGRNHKEISRLINPTNHVGATFKYFKNLYLSHQPFVEIDKNPELVPYKDHHATVLVLVIGETARSMNFSLNGYARKTNPYTAQENIISFPNVTASGTNTAFSVPCLFSNLARSECDPDRLKHTENLVDILQKSGYQILWLENDDGCKGVCDRVPTKNMVHIGHPTQCDKEACFDEVLIAHLAEALKNIRQDTVIVLHLIGSHGPTYYKRYPKPFKVFTPTCDTADLSQCSQQQIINTYDNTIIYSDYVISQAIKVLQKYPQYESGLLYLSDHGESLGENNIYLHGLPYQFAPQEQKKVPMILWMSETMQQEDYIDYECMKKAVKPMPLSHDNFFHSVLGLMEIKTKAYNGQYDIFQPCRTKPLPH